MTMQISPMQAGRAIWQRSQLHTEQIRALESKLAASHVGSQVVVTSIVGILPPSSGGTGFALNGSPLGVTVWLSPGATTQYSVVTSATSRTYGTSTTQGVETVIGVNDDAASGAGQNIRVRHIGYQSSVRVTGAVTAGHYLRQSTSAGVAESAGAVQTSGVFARALSAAAGPGAGNVEAYLFPPVPASLYYSGHLRVGSLAAPSNTTAGDLTAARGFLGDDAAVANLARLRVNVASHVPSASTLHASEVAIIVAPNGSSTSERDGFDIEYQVQPTASDGGLHIASRIYIRHDSGAFNLTHTTNALMGLGVTNDQNVASSTVTYMGAYRGNLRLLAGSATTMQIYHSAITASGTAVDTINHFVMDGLTAGGATVTLHRGLVVGNLGTNSGGSTVTAIAIDISAQSGATTNVGIRNASNSWQTGYAQFGTLAAPSNVASGEVTMRRLRILGVNTPTDSVLTNDTIIGLTGNMTSTSSVRTAVSLAPVAAPASNSTAQYWVTISELIAAPSAGVTLTTLGADLITVTHRQDSTLTDVYGAIYQPVNLDGSSGTVGTISAAYALRVRPYTRFAGTGTVSVTTMTGLHVLMPSHAGATITTLRGVHITNPSASTITTLVGVEIDSLTGATTNIGIRNAATLRQVGNAMFGQDAAASIIVHVHQPTLESEVFRTESLATNDDPSDRWAHGRAATTDATVTTLQTITIPASTTMLLTVWVRARRTGGAAGTAEDGAGYMLVATVKNVAGTATLIGAGAPAVLVAHEDQSAWDATIDVTGATARVRVTGAANNNITWHSTAMMQPVGS